MQEEKPSKTETTIKAYGKCPACDKLVGVDLAIKINLKEEVEESAKGKDAGNGEQENKAGTTESPGVRPDRKEGTATATGASDKPADTGKSAGNKKTGE